MAGARRKHIDALAKGQVWRRGNGVQACDEESYANGDGVEITRNDADSHVNDQEDG